MTVADTAPSPPRSFWMRWRRPLAGLAALMALWTVLIGMWLPGWLAPKVAAAAAEALGTQVALQAMRIRPWTGVVELDGLVVGPAAAPMLKVSHAEAQLSLESVWRLAPVLRRVQVVQPEVWIERQTPERFNFSAVLDKLSAQPKSAEPASEPVHFAVFNIALQDGVIRYTDRVLNQEHRVDKLNIGVPFVSNLPSHEAVEVQPLLTARIDGSPVSIKGETLPFSEGLPSEVKLKWENVDVPHWVSAVQPFIPHEWRAQATQGRLDVDLAVTFEARKPPAVPRLAIDGGLKLSKLAWAWPAAPALGQVAAGWQTLEIQGLHAQPFERQIKLDAVLLDGLHWRNRPLPAGKPVLQVQPVNEVAGAASAVAPAWSWQLGKLQVSTGRLDFQTEAAQAWPAMDMVRVQVSGLDSQAKAKPAGWQIEARDEHGASLQAHGQVQVARQELDAQFNLGKAQIKPWLAPIADALALPLRVEAGDLGVQAQLRARLKTLSALEPAEARLLSGRIGLNGLDARAVQVAQPAQPVKGKGQGAGDRVRLASLVLEGMQAHMDLSDQPALRQLALDTLTVQQLDMAVTRGARGEWLGMPASTASTAANAPVEAAKAHKPAPQVTLKTLLCQACEVRFQDQMVTPPARWEVHQTELHLADLGNDLSRPISLSLDTLAQGKGRVQIKGSVQPQPLLVDLALSIGNLDLRGIQPYVDPQVNITLAGAKAQAKGQFKLQMPARGAMQVRYKGRAGLSDVRLLDRVNNADLVSWQALTLDGLDVGLAGDALDANLGRIGLKDFYGRVIINPDGRLNLAGILRHEAGAEARSLTTPEPATSNKPAVSAAPVAPAAPAVAAPVTAIAGVAKPAPKLRWERIQLSQGRVDFTDNFIKPNYSARLTQVEGDISAVSSTKPEPATVKVSGAVDDAAPLLITGQLHPLGPKLYTDIQGSAKGIELTRLTPYAARYAGYAIEKGTLSVSVSYKVDGGKLEASNQIFLDQLTFGEKTDSPEATKLPVLFAVSLLKNNRGEIDINLPISGSLDDPEFSVGGIIWRVVVNLITKAVTAPFALLSGGGADELGYVAFEPGRAELSDVARQGLDTLATKLLDRPALKLEATGRAEPMSDAEGLRRAHVDALMRAAKAKASGQAASEVSIPLEERSRWLAEAYKAADIKKPRNVIGLAKTLPDAEMEALLKASASAGPEALRALANQRGDAVKAYLAHKMPPERVLLTASKVGTEGVPDDKGPPTRVQFEIK